MRKKWVLIPAWLTVALLTVSPAAQGQEPAATVDVAAVAARIDALHVRISGDHRELQATELLNYHRVQGGIAACMRAAGKTYRVGPFVGFYEGFTDADLGYGAGSGTVFDSITDRGRRHVRNEIGFARLDRAGALEWGPVRPADVPALNRCTAPYGHRLYYDIDPPAGTYQLAGFGDLFEPVAADPRVVAAMRPYRSCMKTRYGYDVDERTDFLYAPRISREDAPLPGRPANVRWKRGIKAMQAAFDADTACRLPAYRIAMTLVAPRIGAWERRHRAEIRTIEAEWHRRRIAAQGLPRTISG